MPALTLHLDGLVFGKPGTGGIRRVFCALLAEWRKMDGVDVCLYLHPGTDPAMFRALAREVVVLREPRPWRPCRLFRAWNGSRRRRATERDWAGPAEGVFMSSYYTTHDALRVPQVLVLQDMIYERYAALFPGDKGDAHREEKRRCAEAASAFISPSDAAMREAGQFYDLGSRPATVIPYAAEQGFFTAPDPGSGERLRRELAAGHEYVLYVGGRGPHKNFAGLLAAYARWPTRRRLHLLAVGGGAPGPCDTLLLESFGLNGQVHFAPVVSDEALIALYHGARAVVVPSLCEGYGFPVIEALAAGRPVAASTGGSLPEVGADAAIYFDPLDGESILRALDEAVETPDDAPRIRRGKQWAASRTWTQVAEDYVNFLREVIATP